MFCFGCKKEIQKPQIDYPVYNDTIPHMLPSRVVYSDVEDAELQKDKKHLLAFVNKNWNEKNHYSFLVVKNGAVIFEKYQGFSDIQK